MEPDEREYVVHTSTVAGGDERTLLLRIRPGWAPDQPAFVDVIERHRGESPGWSGRARSFAVTAHLEDVGPLIALLEARLGIRLADGDLADRLVAALTAVARRGDLDSTLPPMAVRERVAGWFTEAGVPHRWNTWLPMVHLARRLTLWFHLKDPSWVRFIEYADERRTFEVTTAYNSIDTVIAHLAQRYGPIRFDGHPDDTMNHLVAVLATLVEHGSLGEPLPAGASADQIATWYAEAGVTHQRGGERRHTLLRTYRDNTGCTFELTLGMSSRDSQIWFAEHYDYHSRSGDAGREYSYSVKTPYTSLDRLVAFFTTQLDSAIDGDPEDRLLACFTQLIERGDLADTGLIEDNRDRVARWFNEAQVPAEPDFWIWMNSD